MNSKSFPVKVSAFLLAFLLATSQLVNAAPLFFQLPKIQDDSKNVKKLPPVNYIRSRTIDVKHVAIDLRFDWDKEQAYGSTVVTLAPFKDTNKFFLDAASMTINSVALANGTTLRFSFC